VRKTYSIVEEAVDDILMSKEDNEFIEDALNLPTDL
jgi:hypothetical protein